MKKHIGKFFFLAILFSFAGLVHITSVKAASYLNAFFMIVNDPTLGLHQGQHAPSTLKLAFFSYSYTDKSDTSLKIDCNNDGSYEINRMIPVSPWYPYRGEGQMVVYEIGSFSHSMYVDPRSNEPAYWASAKDNSLICTYPSAGSYTIKMVAERGGLKQEMTRSFTINPPLVDMQAKGFYKNGIIGTLYLPGPSIVTGEPIRVPADIDVGVAVYSNRTEWPLFTPYATLQFDCNGDGKIDATKGYSTTTNVSNWGQEWTLWCMPYSNTGSMWTSCKNPIQSSMNWYSKACHYDKPGMYTATVKAELPTGGAPYVRDTWFSVPVLPGDSNATINFSTGSDPVFGEAPLKGVDLKVDIAGITWANAVYTFDCGNGQTKDYSIISTNPADFIQDYSYNLKDFCNYTIPGEYTAKVKLEFNALNFIYGTGGVRNVLLPSTLFTKVSEMPNYTVYVAKKELRVVAAGKVAEGEYVITSPFNLRWDVDVASSCTISRLNGIYSQTFNKSIGTIEGISLAPGVYDYKLNCTSKSGGVTEKIIKLNVVKP
jgi:hypothetical protein